MYWSHKPVQSSALLPNLLVRSFNRWDSAYSIRTNIHNNKKSFLHIFFYVFYTSIFVIEKNIFRNIWRRVCVNFLTLPQKKFLTLKRGKNFSIFFFFGVKKNLKMNAYPLLKMPNYRKKSRLFSTLKIGMEKTFLRNIFWNIQKNHFFSYSDCLMINNFQSNRCYNLQEW